MNAKQTKLFLDYLKKPRTVRDIAEHFTCSEDRARRMLAEMALEGAVHRTEKKVREGERGPLSTSYST